MENLIIKKGTLIHFQGLPFELPEDTEVLGNKNNLAMAEKFEQEFAEMGAQGTVELNSSRESTGD